MPYDKDKLIFEVVAAKGENQSQISCDNWSEFQKAAKEYYLEGFKTMTVYGFNENGFVKRTTYIRGKESWLILK